MRVRRMITYDDPSTLPESSTDDTPDKHRVNGYCEACDTVHDLICPKCKSARVQADNHGFKEANIELITARWRQLLMHAQQQKNSKYFIGCILIATGDSAAEGVTMEAYAKEWGKTKADVSKNCVAICAYLGATPRGGMKSEACKKNFVARNQRPPTIP